MLNLLEEEVVIDKLGLDFFAHSLKRVEGSLQISLEGVQSSDYFVHDLKSLLLSKTRAKGIVSKVSSDSDTG